MTWWILGLFVLGVVLYGYSISSTIKVAGSGCSTCPYANKNKDFE
jgi:hypothetical protein